MEIKLNNNDIVTLFTDGITEAQNSQYEEFGFSRLERIIFDNSQAEPDILSKNIMQEVSLFSQGNTQHDDITLLTFKWKFNNKSSGES